MNNLWLVGLSTVVILVAIWIGLVGGLAIVRWLFHTSRVPALARLGDWLTRLARTVAVIGTAVALSGALALIGYSLWKEHDYQVWADRATTSLTTAVLWALAKKAMALVGLLIAFFYFHRLGKAILPGVEERVSRHPAVEDHSELVGRIFGDLPRCLTLILVYVVVYSTTSALELPSGLAWLIDTLSFIAMIAGSSRLLVQICHLALELFDGYLARRLAGTSAFTYYEKVQQLRPLTRRVVEAIVYVAAATLIVGKFESLGPFAPYGPIIIQIIALFLLTRVVIELASTLIYNVMLSDDREADADRPAVESPESRKRRVTLTHLLQRLVKYLIYVGMVLWMLVIVGVNPVPLVAAAGIIGFAVGLGSQKILQDVICGFFMLFEDQMLIGDYVRIDDTEGVVEQLYLRIVRIRDRLGRVHIMRNGDIVNVINYSRGWTLAVVEMSVAYEADLSKVMRVMSEVGVKLHELMPERVIEPAVVMGIEAMDDSCLRVRVEARVTPGGHYEVKRLLNRLLFDAFVEHDLEIPYPKGIEFDSVPVSAPVSAPRPDPAAA